MEYDYTAFFSSVCLSIDRAEFKINDRISAERLLNANKNFKKSNTFVDEFHGEDYFWRKYQYKHHVFFLINPVDETTYYKPRIILSKPSEAMEKEMLKTLNFNSNFYHKLSQLEITLDFVFKSENLYSYAEDIIKQIERNTHIIWSRNSTTFDYVGPKCTTKYRTNSQEESIQTCTKPIRMYPKEVNGKHVLRFELMLNNTSADKISLPFKLNIESLFKYIRFYKNNFNPREIAKLIERISDKYKVDAAKLRRSINRCNNSDSNINEKILKLKNIVKNNAPEYHATRSLNNCFVEDLDLTAFILNNLYIKGR